MIKNNAAKILLIKKITTHKKQEYLLNNQDILQEIMIDSMVESLKNINEIERKNVFENFDIISSRNNIVVNYEDIEIKKYIYNEIIENKIKLDKVRSKLCYIIGINDNYANSIIQNAIYHNSIVDFLTDLVIETEDFITSDIDKNNNLKKKFRDFFKYYEYNDNELCDAIREKFLKYEKQIGNELLMRGLSDVARTNLMLNFSKHCLKEEKKLVDPNLLNPDLLDLNLFNDLWSCNIDNSISEYCRNI